MRRTRKALLTAVAVALPLALVGGGALTLPGKPPTQQGRAWSGRWVTTTPPTLTDVGVTIGPDTGSTSLWS